MSEHTSSKRYLTVLVVPDRGQESRNIRLSYTMLRILAGVAAILALLLTLVAGSWWYLAARAARVKSETTRACSSCQSDGATARVAMR